MATKKIIIGSRGSKLAVTQSEFIAAELKKKNPSLEIVFKTIVTMGDRDAQSSLQAIGGKGVFVKEIEEALLKKEIDLAIHSLKDLPQNLPSGLMLGASPLREDPRDVLISRFGEQLNELPKHSIIGTSSPRRQAQIYYRYKKRGYRLEPMRGNVDTRVKKVQEGQFDAIVLAYAGLKRLGLESEITQVLEADDIMPAPGQGCLGLEIREDDKDLAEILYSIQHVPSDIAARAERSFLQGIGGDCNVPLGAFSTIKDGKLIMRAIVLDPKGEKAATAEEEGPINSPELVGAQLAGRLLFNGGSEILK